MKKVFKSKKIFVLFSVILALFFSNLISLSFLFDFNKFDNYKVNYAQENLSYQSNVTDDTNLFVQDEQIASSQSQSLPEAYSLYNFSTYNKYSENYPNNVGNQRGTNICWAFATLTSFESTLYKLGIVSIEQTLNFSEVDLAYNVFKLSRGYDSFGGGSFELAYEYLSTNGAVYEQSWENPSSSTSESLNWSNDSIILESYDLKLNQYQPVDSNYVALESYFFPSREIIEKNDDKQGISQSITDQKIEDLRNDIKTHIMTYGAVTASIAYDTNYLFNNSSFCNSTIASSNHLVTLVGWDDNFDSNGHKGAYIAQNSYGTSFGNGGYFYIFYDDYQVENNVTGFIRVGEKDETSYTYDNMLNSEYQNRFVTISENGNTYTTSYFETNNNAYLTNFFQVSDYKSQKLELIKVPTVCVSSYDSNTGLYTNNNDTTSFRVYLINNISYQDVKNASSSLTNIFQNKIPIKNKNATSGDEYLFSSNQTGFYTIDIIDDIVINGDYFAIIVETIDGPIFFMNNNSDQSISSPTYFTTRPTSGWSIYSTTNFDGSSIECIYPMVVETSVGSLEYSVNDIESTYDGQVKIPTINVYSTSDYDIYYSLTGNAWSKIFPEIKDVLYDDNNQVSFYIVYIKIVANLYEDVYDSLIVKILPRELILTPDDDNSKIYGDKDGIINYTFSNIVNQEIPQVTGRLSRESGENVGQYNITQGNLKLATKDNFKSGNYFITFVENVKFEITKRKLNIIPTNKHKIYGEIDSAFVYEIENLVGNEKPDLTLDFTRESGEDYGEYAFILNNYSLRDNPGSSLNNYEYFSADNYELVFNPNNIKYNIYRRPIYITPNAGQTKVFNQDDPKFTYTFSNSAINENVKIEGCLTRESGEDVGYYSYNIDKLKLVDNYENNVLTTKASNYYLVLVNENKFFISNGQIQGIVFEDNIFVYNNQEHFIDFTVPQEYQNDIIVKYCEGGTFDEQKGSTEKIGKVNVGEYQITIQFNLKNYDTLVQTKTLTIQKRDLVITPIANQSRIYGESNNILFRYSNNVANQIPSFSGELSLSNFSESVGEYVISAGNLSLQDYGEFRKENYNIVFENKDNLVYTINKRELIVIPDSNQSKLYSKQEKTLLYNVKNLCSFDTLELVGSLSRTQGEDVGIYLINLGSLSLGNSLVKNYNLVLSNQDTYFEILPLPIIVNILDVTRYYGQVLNDFNQIIYNGYEVVGSQISEDLQLEFTCYEYANKPINNLTRKNDSGYIINAVSNNPNFSCTINSGRYYIIYNNYTVNFVLFDDIITIQNVEHFTKFSILPDSVNTNILGYEFICWKVDDFRVDLQDYIIEKDTTFVAEFDIIKYNLNYELDGGSLPADAETYFTIKDSFVIEEPKKEGYVFDGWYDNENFLGERIVEIKQGSYNDLTLYAKFDIIVYSVTLPENTVGQEVQGNSQIEFGKDYFFDVVLSSEYNKSYQKMKVYAVYGDYREQLNPIYSGLDKNSYVVKQVNENFKIELEGITINIYEINFVADGKVVATYSVQHGQELNQTLPNIPMKEHYTQSSPTWEEKQLTNITSDMTVNALYVPDIYKITFILPNGEIIESNVTYGQTVNTEILNNNYQLNLFEYYTFDKDLSKISEDSIVNVSIGSNIYVLYIIIGIIISIIIGIVIAIIIRNRRRSKFSWWVYSKENLPKKK